MNAKKLFAVAVAALGTVAFTNATAKAQWQDIAAMNAQFDANFDVMARQMSWQVALATPNDQPLPFNAMTISHSITEGSDAALGYVEQGQVNSNRACNAVENYSTYAIQGNGYYRPEYGGQYVLPYATAPEGGYNLQNGYVMPGYVEGGNNFYIDPQGAAGGDND